jgi:hypothetical protein
MEKSDKAVEIRNAFTAMELNMKEMREEAGLNWELVFGDHWAELTAQQKIEKFDNKGRIEVSMPTLYPKVQSLLGFQKSMREQFEAIPKGNEDELQAQIINTIYRHIEENTTPKKYKYSESDAFQDALFEAFGAVEIYKEMNNEGNEEVRLRYLPSEEMYFDRNFTDVEHENCGRIQHAYVKYLDELKVMYPDKEEELKKADKMADNTDTQMYNGEVNKDKIHVIRDWKKQIKIFYELHCIEESEVYLFETESEAKEKLEELRYKKRQAVEEVKRIMIMRNAMQSLSQGIQDGVENIKQGIPNVPQNMPNESGVSSSMGNIPPIPTLNPSKNQSSGEELPDEEEYIVKRVPRMCVEYTVSAGDVIVEESKIIPYEFHPVTLMILLYVKTKGKGRKLVAVLSIVRLLQQYIDRLWSQLDYNIGTDAKTGAEMNVDLIATEYQEIEDARKAYVEGGIVYKHGTVPALTPFAHSVTDPTYFRMFETLFAMETDVFGGSNFQGIAESKDQSGKAIQKLQAQAQIMALNIMDNLKRFKEIIGRKLLHYIKDTYTYQTTMRVMGENLTDQVKKALAENGMYKESIIHNGIGYMLINQTDEDKNKLYDSNVDIIVESAKLRQDEKDVEFQKLIMLKTQLGINVPPQALFETMDLKATTKQKIIDEYNKQQQTSQIQQQYMMEKAKQDLGKDEALKFKEYSMGQRNIASIKEHADKNKILAMKYNIELNKQNNEIAQKGVTNESPDNEEPIQPIPEGQIEQSIADAYGNGNSTPDI